MIIFERSKNLGRIAEEIDRLRTELASFRERILKAKLACRFGRGDEVAKAATAWQQVIDKIVRSYEKQPHLVVRRFYNNWTIGFSHRPYNPVTGRSQVPARDRILFHPRLFGGIDLRVGCPNDYFMQGVCRPFGFPLQ